MHVGHDPDEIDHHDQAIRHLGAGIIQEGNGNLAAALEEYRAALDLDPGLEAAKSRMMAIAKTLSQ